MIKLISILSILLYSVLIINSWHVQSANARPTSGLYGPDDGVMIMNSTTFVPTVFHQNKNITYMVQFYNSFCGHCQMFSPTYKQLASRVKNWTSVIRVAALDCSQEENIITCSENKIYGYPTIFIYPPNARAQEPKDAPLDLRSLSSGWAVDDLEDVMVDYIGNLTGTDREIPSIVEAMKPFRDSDMSTLKRIYPHMHEHDVHVDNHYRRQDLMFVIESEKSYHGRKLMLEYYRISSRLELRRILTSNRALLETLLPREDFERLDEIQPLLVQVKTIESSDDLESRGHILVRGEGNKSSASYEMRDAIYTRFTSFLDQFYSVELNELTGSDIQPRDRPKSRLPDKETPKANGETEIQYLIHNGLIESNKIFAIDLLKGLVYMITHEIPLKGDLSPQDYQTVRNLLRILKKFLPLDEWDPAVSKFVNELRSALDGNRESYEKSGLSGREFRFLLESSDADSIKSRYSRENWVSCYESDRKHKGYTCSIWLIFHAMTVEEFSKAAPVISRPVLVLTTMRDYIINFFGCTVCSSNFKKETESLEASLNSRNSSIFWLWNTHNSVNQRLNNENVGNTRPLHEVIYPSSSSCAKCLKTSWREVDLDGKNLDDLVWDHGQIFNFLQDTYSPSHIVSPTKMAFILSKAKGKVGYDLIGNRAGQKIDTNRSIEQWRLHNILSTSDIGFCIVLYLACIILVAIVCVALNPRWRRLVTK